MDSNVANEIDEAAWEEEVIPDGDYLYMRVHKTQLDEEGEPIPGTFKNRPTDSDGMSTDWDKYSTPEETRQRARVPFDNIVIRLKVGAVRTLPEQLVKHTPNRENNNRAHTDVFGRKTTQVREKFMQIYESLPI